MKKIVTGILALIIPVFLFSQSGKEVQDLNVIQKKLATLEKDNFYLKKQLQGVQKAIASWNMAEAGEQLEMKKLDSVMRAAQDTVTSYSAKLLKLQEDLDEVGSTLKMRRIVFGLVILVILIMIAVRWFLHGKAHKAEVADLEEKMQAQKAERDQKIAEVYDKMQAQKEERDAKFAQLGALLKAQESLGEMKFTELHGKLHAQKEEREQRISEILARIHTTNDEQDRKLAELRSLLEQQGKEMIQKVADAGKRLDEQIISAHRKTDELKSALTREIQDIRSKFE